MQLGGQKRRPAAMTTLAPQANGSRAAFYGSRPRSRSLNIAVTKNPPACEKCNRGRSKAQKARGRRDYERDVKAGVGVRCHKRPATPTNKRCQNCQDHHAKQKDEPATGRYTSPHPGQVYRGRLPRLRASLRKGEERPGPATLAAGLSFRRERHGTSGVRVTYSGEEVLLFPTM